MVKQNENTEFAGPSLSLEEMIAFYMNLYDTSTDLQKKNSYYQTVRRFCEETETQEDIRFVFYSMYPNMYSNSLE